MPNYKVSSDIDTILRKSTKGEVATFLGVDANTSGVATNASNIATNTSSIATNTSSIATNTADIATNTANIATNTANIATNASGVATNASNIATNTADIATNTANIATNTADIASNDTDIGILTGSVVQNQTDIATNAANIATNAANIATNTSNIQDYQFGTFNPTFALVTGSTTYNQSTYDTRLGYYVKIGRVVVVNFRIKITDPDSAIINAPQTSSFAITNMPYPALTSGIAPDISVLPRRGWQNLGDKSHSGVIYNDYMYFYKNQTQSGGAGVGWNLSNLTPSDFSVNPFNFVESSGGAFSFFGSGSYITNDD
jgi:sulfite reductase alpha subunit-like flavoprotein